MQPLAPYMEPILEIAETLSAPVESDQPRSPTEDYHSAKFALLQIGTEGENSVADSTKDNLSCVNVLGPVTATINQGEDSVSDSTKDNLTREKEMTIVYLNRSTLGRCGSVDGKLGRVPAPASPETASDQPVNLYIVSAPYTLASAPQQEFGGQYPIHFKSAANAPGVDSVFTCLDISIFSEHTSEGSRVGDRTSSQTRTSHCCAFATMYELSVAEQISSWHGFVLVLFLSLHSTWAKREQARPKASARFNGNKSNLRNRNCVPGTLHLETVSPILSCPFISSKDFSDSN